MGDTPALEIGQLVIRAGGLHDGDKAIALEFGFIALDREWHGTGQIDSKSGRAGGEARDVEAPRTHRFDLGCIRLYRIVDDALASAAAEIFGEGAERELIDRRVFD